MTQTQRITREQARDILGWLPRFLLRGRQAEHPTIVLLQQIAYPGGFRGVLKQTERTKAHFGARRLADSGGTKE